MTFLAIVLGILRDRVQLHCPVVQISTHPCDTRCDTPHQLFHELYRVDITHMHICMHITPHDFTIVHLPKLRLFIFYSPTLEHSLGVNLLVNIVT